MHCFLLVSTKKTSQNCPTHAHIAILTLPFHSTKTLLVWLGRTVIVYQKYLGNKKQGCTNSNLSKISSCDVHKTHDSGVAA